VNNCSVGGRTRHVANKAMYLRELKEWGVLKVVYQAGSLMCSNLFTKNLPKTTFKKHASHYLATNLSDSGATEPEPQFASVEKQHPVEQQQARESAGFEEKQQSRKVQVCDNGHLQQLNDCVRTNDNKSNG
jgi:hypothetical protein